MRLLALQKRRPGFLRATLDGGGKITAGRPIPWAGLVLLLGTALVVPSGWAGAEELSDPPGVNVKAQESLLKLRVSDLARNLVGDKFVDVVVSVNYLRSEEIRGDAQKVKLPGLNQFVVIKGQEKEVVSGYTRVRHILVMIADTFPLETEAVAQELRLTGKIEAARGDSLKVIKVPERQEPTGEDDQFKGLSERLQAMQEADTPPPMKKPNPVESISEGESTAYLLRARTAYFQGKYNLVLDQILQSIAKNPDNPQAYAMLGSLYYAVDWKHMAVKYWEKSLALDPDNFELRNLVDEVRLGSPQ